MLQLILLQVITFVVIIVVLRLLFGTQLKNALSRLQILHQESLEKEEIINKELERAKVQSQSEITRSQEEAKNILETARANTDKIILEASERGQIEAKKIIAEAEEKIKRSEQDYLASIDAKAVDLALDLIKYTFSQKGYQALQSYLIDELIEELKALDKTKLTVHADHAEVTSAIALTEEEKRNLADLLALKLDKKVALSQQTDDSLMGGLVIKFGGLVIDGSLKTKLSRVINTLRLKK